MQTYTMFYLALTVAGAFYSAAEDGIVTPALMVAIPLPLIGRVLGWW